MYSWSVLVKYGKNQVFEIWKDMKKRSIEIVDFRERFLHDLEAFPRSVNSARDLVG